MQNRFAVSGSPSPESPAQAKLSCEAFVREFFGELEIDDRVTVEFYEDYLRGRWINVGEYRRATLRLADTGAMFPLGRTVMTRGAQAALEQSGQDAITFLRRHQAGDWGDVDAGDAAENWFSLGNSLRLFSIYHTAAGQKLYVITEADRSASTLLLPHEY